ncbi:MAG: ABC transporter ATP-binding protein/permease [Bacilli bacterium]|jgi:ATP-binding cassette subfamily B protein|nr:ABC transporter ATP-binding protein/permease [Bacilli bacterium]
MRTIEEEKLPNKFNLGIWLRIGKYALREWPLLLVIIFTMIVTTYYDSSFVPSMNKGAVDALDGLIVPVSNVWAAPITVNFLFGGNITLSYMSFLIVEAVMIVLRSLAIFWTFFLTNYVDMCIMTDLRRDSFHRIQELSFSYFDKTNSGWLIARMNNDTGSIGDVLSWDIISIFWALFDLFFTIATMFVQNWVYALIVLASVPLVAIIVPIFERALLKRWRTARNAYSHFVGWLAEAINGSKTIKTLSIEDEVADEAKEITDDISVKRWKAGRMNAFFQPLVSLISSAMIAIVVAVGLNDISAGNALITVGTLVIFVGFVQSIYDPLQQLSEIFSDFMASQAGAEKVGQLLDAKPGIVDKPEVLAKYGDVFNPKKENYEPIKGDIDFKKVTFDYGNGVEVIHPLTLHVRAGTSLAIVGETGSGKTTMVNLLCRFYEPTSGSIDIDGTNYLERSLGWLRSSIGYVQQTPFAFSATYRENIRYGKRDATDAEIEAAAKLVGLHDFVMGQPKGYDTVLEDGGASLSQGQKQLLSFARAIIRNPAILILDEATSSIDTETEAAVQKAIQPLLKGRTSITIAHRLSTIVNSDRILVMDHGKIIEDGDHVSLMNKKGAYYELYMNQFRDLSMESQISTYETQIENKNIDL